mmetsp:Transcript_100067/g.173727  ORF Transcript_100067/g.173727 Transcript_100067/m.173727 type:complete len:135 (-) Transcript_100067:68-472(-)
MWNERFLSSGLSMAARRSPVIVVCMLPALMLGRVVTADTAHKLVRSEVHASEARRHHHVKQNKSQQNYVTCAEMETDNCNFVDKENCMMFYEVQQTPKNCAWIHGRPADGVNDAVYHGCKAQMDCLQPARPVED